MPIITTRKGFNGFETKVRRLALENLQAEVELALTSFELRVAEERYANGTRGIRQRIDEQFETVGGWTKTTVGGIDWKKTNEGNSSLGVEVQVSGRSDLLAVDVLHLQKELRDGSLDAGIIVVPNDILSKYLTDRTPNLRTALRHIDDTMPVQVIAFQHDGPGPALPKMRTNLGRK